MKEYTAVISQEAEEYIPYLCNDFEVLTLAPDKLLQRPVQCHADMILGIVEDRVILPEHYITENQDLVRVLRERCALEVIACTDERRAEYPFDIGLNVLISGKHAFSLKSSTSFKYTELLQDLGYTHINIRQGYAACSTLSFDNFLITADPSVEKAANKVGIDVMKISAGHIYLEGYDTGFIGGASGVCGNRIYFLGNIDLHPDGENIREYICTHGYEIVCLSDNRLSDMGGIKFVKNVGCKV